MALALELSDDPAASCDCLAVGDRAEHAHVARDVDPRPQTDRGREQLVGEEQQPPGMGETLLPQSQVVLDLGQVLEGAAGMEAGAGRGQGGALRQRVVARHRPALVGRRRRLRVVLHPGRGPGIVEPGSARPARTIGAPDLERSEGRALPIQVEADLHHFAGVDRRLEAGGHRAAREPLPPPRLCGRPRHVREQGDARDQPSREAVLPGHRVVMDLVLRGGGPVAGDDAVGRHGGDATAARASAAPAARDSAMPARVADANQARAGAGAITPPPGTRQPAPTPVNASTGSRPRHSSPAIRASRTGRRTPARPHIGSNHRRAQRAPRGSAPRLLCSLGTS